MKVKISHIIAFCVGMFVLKIVVADTYRADDFKTKKAVKTTSVRVLTSK